MTTKDTDTHNPAPADQPVAVHQFRKQYCANWYDGHPDHTDGGGPYEERTLYTAPVQEPQTLDQAMQLPRAMAQAYENGYNAGVAYGRLIDGRSLKDSEIR